MRFGKTCEHGMVKTLRNVVMVGVTEWYVRVHVGNGNKRGRENEPFMDLGF